MSLRYEQYYSLLFTKEFLRDLMLKHMPRKEMKERIRRCLRHYPPLTKVGKPMFSQDELSSNADELEPHNGNYLANNC